MNKWGVWRMSSRALWGVVVLVSLFHGRLLAQTTLVGDRLRLNGGPCVLSSLDGTPDKLVFSVCPVLTTAPSTNLTVQPTGDLVLAPVGRDIVPDTGYTQNLGALSNKYLTLHAAELWVETLVAQNTIATIGGRVLVAPTTTLTADLAPGATTIEVKHNQMAQDDRVYLEADGKVEWLSIESAPSGSGPYTYTVARNLDGSGPNQWYAGDAVLNTGGLGDGFIDLYSVSGVLAGVGPTVVGNVRTNWPYNNIAPRWAIGELNGLYNYSASTFGFAAGDAAGTHVTVDAANGFRIRSGTTNKLVADTSGNLSLTGDLAVGTSGVVRSGTATGLLTGDGFWIQGGATPAFRIGNPAGNRLVYDASTGQLNLFGNGGGLTSIGPGSLTVGAGRNIVRNADCAASTADWSAFTTSGQTLTFSRSYPNFSLNGAGGTCYLQLGGSPANGTASEAFLTTVIPVQPGSRYEGSAYLGGVRTGGTFLSIQWTAADGTTFIGSSNGNTCAATIVNGLTLDQYCRSGVVATAPAGAYNARLIIHTDHNGTNDPFVFFVHAYFGEAGIAQTELTPWGPAGVTEIIGGLVRTGTIQATHLSVGTLSAISANLGTVTAGSMTGVTATFGGAVTLDGNGISLTEGSGVVNRVKWTGGSHIYEFVALNIVGTTDVAISTGGAASVTMNTSAVRPQSNNVTDLGGASANWRDAYIRDVILGSGTITKSGWAGGGSRAVCVDNGGAVYAATGATCP